MIALSQVLWLVRAAFALQIDRESDDLRERLLRELCDVLALDTPDRSDPVRDVLREAARCGDGAIEAKAERALKILAVIETLDALEEHKREEREAQMFGDARAEHDGAPPCRMVCGASGMSLDAAGTKMGCDGCYCTLFVGERDTWPTVEEAVAAAHGAGWTGDAHWSLCAECSAARSA